MRRLTISLFLCLILSSSAFPAQDNTTKATKKPKAEKATPAECSTVTDQAITAGVKERLAKAPSLKNVPIDVETKDGTVTLKGMVKTGGLKGVATRMTKRVDCVKKVDNQLSVEQSTSKKKPASK